MTSAADSAGRRRVFLHIGLHKTGTTYLQNLMRANREGLRGQGVEFPGDGEVPAQALAVWDLQGGRPGDVDDRRIPGAWPAVAAAINESELPNALLSIEWLSLSGTRQIRRAVRSFPDRQVHVVVTVRDLARVLVSAWQEDVKNEETFTWTEFIEAVKDPSRVATSPARGFWARQDVVRICEKWAAVVPADRIHIVTVPQPPTPSTQLLTRFAAAVGFDATLLTEAPAWTNETVGVAATEVLRQLNVRLAGRLNRRMHAMLVKSTLAPMLAQRTEPVRFTLPPEELGWAAERSRTFVEALTARGYPVVGDLDDLRPREVAGRRPDDARTDELLDASMDALALLSERFATAWWQRRRPDEPVDESLGAQARGAVVRGRRRAAELAEKSPTVMRALSAVTRARDKH